MQIDPTIFREYDIRGTVDKNLNEEFAEILGRAYGSLAVEQGRKRIAIGHDCRLSSPAYAKALAKGIASTGLHVLLTGMGPTPQLYFAVFNFNLDGGIQVTGSHNPADMNGFKILLGKDTLSGAAIQEIKKRCLLLAENSLQATEKIGTIEDLEVQAKYIDYLVENSREYIGSRKLKVVVDAGNGVGGLIGPTVLRRLGVEVVELYCDPDGRFPNHHPDPTELHNIEALIKTVKHEKADFGIGWDGDADRIGAVDENGNVLYGDMLVLLYSRTILKEVPGATIIGDVKCSHKLFDDVASRGGKPLMWKTGHSLIKQKLKETGAELAGEMSGHIFFKHRFFGFDDALYASSRLVEIVSNVSEPLSKLLVDLPKTVSTPEIRVDCSEETKFKVALAAQAAFPEYSVDTTDGVRVRFKHGWGLVRASNTQPILVMRFEAESEEELESYQALVTTRIETIKREFV
jgi:phosphomannomutase / phosphoglucomutase